MPDVIYLRKSRADLELESRSEVDVLARHEAQRKYHKKHRNGRLCHGDDYDLRAKLFKELELEFAADGEGAAYGILKAGGFKERFKCLRNASLTGHIKGVRIPNAVQCKTNLIVFAFNIVPYIQQAFSFSGHVDSS